jgi:hypothetical protein
MEIIVALAGLILVAVFIFDRERLQVDLTAIGKFLKIVLIGSALSFVIRYSLGRIPTLPPVGFGSLLLVWWEDVLFSLLSIFYAEKFLPKWVFVPVAVSVSIVFGLGHLYQGPLAVLVLSFYPYFMSYKYGKKYGYGTVMICHVLYDVIVCGCSLLLSKAQ